MTSKNTHTIDIVFENGEVISFHVGNKHKSFVSLGGITRSMFIGLTRSENDFTYNISRTFLRLKREDLVETKTSIFNSHSWQRIKSSDDIEQIHVNKNGESVFWGFVEWGENSDYSNPYQNNEIHKDYIDITIQRT